MSTITSARFWKDTTFTEGSMEVPYPNRPLPSTYLEFTDLNPTKSRMFNEIRVPEDYITLLDYSYMSITVSNNNGPDKTFYGWIDSLTVVSDTSDAPITQVNWHVDLWRTYVPSAEFGMGIVKRRPSSASFPPQQPSYRYRTPGTSVPLYQNDGIWWVYVSVTTEDSQNRTSIEVRAIPVTKNLYEHLYINETLGTAISAMNLQDIFWGDWDEKWQLKPENILSVFVSPIAPTSITGDGSQASPIMMVEYGFLWKLGGTADTGYFTTQTTSGGSPTSYPFREKYQAFDAPIQTTDVTEYVIRGFSGESIGTLPWGIPVQGVYSRVVYSVTSCYIQLRFLPSSESTSWDATRANQYGLVFNIPLWAVDATENSWSSYVYSGQRQYDKDQRSLATRTNAVNGGLSLGASALTGAASGAMLGSVVPGVGTVAGALVGALGGAMTGAITTTGSYAYDKSYKNDEMRRMDDYLHAQQSDGLLLPGNGIDCIIYGTQLSIIPVTIDQYSQTQYNNDISMYGVKVCEPTSNCASLINARGPLQIENLLVIGDIPPAAKDYIKQRFSQGVIIR